VNLNVFRSRVQEIGCCDLSSPPYSGRGDIKRRNCRETCSCGGIFRRRSTAALFINRLRDIQDCVVLLQR